MNFLRFSFPTQKKKKESERIVIVPTLQHGYKDLISDCIKSIQVNFCHLASAQQILAIISYKLFKVFQFRSDAILILVTSSGKTKANHFVLCPCYSEFPQFAMDMDLDGDICIYYTYEHT